VPRQTDGKKRKRNPAVEEIRRRLFECCERIQPQELFPTLVPEAADLIVNDPFAFLLATSLDRGTKAEVIWTIPYWIKQRIGHLDSCLLYEMSLEAIQGVLDQLPRRPRYMADAPKTIKQISELLCRRYSGDAEALWRGRTALETKRTLLQIHGIGKGIASMALLLLERCRSVRFPDWSNMDVKADVHVQRVLYRLGVSGGLGEKEAIAAAQRLNPQYPGMIDPPLWVIGRRWCSETRPSCQSCWMTDLCPRIGVLV
jgi:endonuclease III